jgi:hypothetical protein
VDFGGGKTDVIFIGMEMMDKNNWVMSAELSPLVARFNLTTNGSGLIIQIPLEALLLGFPRNEDLLDISFFIHLN